MLNKQEVLRFLSEHKQELWERFSVRKIGLFGSFCREQATEVSDIDILVNLEHPTFDNYLDLKFYLEDNLGRSVDLVLADSVKPRLKPVIDREVVYA
ncbi:MAG: nucleotidyltransferase family protein [bacterium]|nr:nucleotidyltransferase family protein [bacterium]